MTAVTHRFKEGDRVVLNPDGVAEWDRMSSALARNTRGKTGVVERMTAFKAHPAYDVFWEGYGSSFVYEVEILPEGPVDYTNKDEGGVV